MFKKLLILASCVILALGISIGSVSIFRSTEKLYDVKAEEVLCSGVSVPSRQGAVVTKSGFPFRGTQEVGVIYGGCTPEEKVLPIANSPYTWQLFANWLVWSGMIILAIIGVQKYANTRH